MGCALSLDGVLVWRAIPSADSPFAAKGYDLPAIVASEVALRDRGRWALRSVTLSAGHEATGIAGRRGAGKTALLALLAGLVAPARGELSVLGQDLRTCGGRGAIQGRVGLVPPPGRPGGFTVAGLVTHAAWLMRLPASLRAARVASALERLSLPGWAGSPVTAVPEHVARRAWLAACTVHQPELLLVDGLLDGVTDDDAQTLATCLRNLAANWPIVVAGRDHTRLSLCCPRVLSLHDGTACGG